MLLSPRAYLNHLKIALDQSSIIQDWTLINEQILLDRGHLRVRCTLITGDFLEASEFFIIRATGIEQHRYRYQWMDPSKTHLKRRWDNAPHFPEIPSFPHHVHIDQENQVFPSAMMGIADLLVILEELLGGG